LGKTSDFETGEERRDFFPKLEEYVGKNSAGEKPERGGEKKGISFF
jgi:hypothetical protein